MTNERFNEIWVAVIHNAFYDVGHEDSTITHQEMIELIKLAKKGMQNEKQ